MVLAPAIAIINSLGNLGGFVAPFGFGVIKEQTGTVTIGLVVLSLFALAAAAAVTYFRRDKEDIDDVADLPEVGSDEPTVAAK